MTPNYSLAWSLRPKPALQPMAWAQKPPAPKTSWWLGVQPEQFRAVAKQQARRMSGISLRVP